MIDLHTHTTFSDGEVIPAETARRAQAAGYAAMAFTDHADASNLAHILENISKVSKRYSPFAGLDLFSGVEITHVPPGLIGETAELARSLGAELVVVHGETIAEPVEIGTNLAAIEARVDILAPPRPDYGGGSRTGGSQRRVSGDHHPPGAQPDQRARGRNGPENRGPAGNQ